MLYFGMDHCDGRQNFSLIVTFVIICLFININKNFESKFEHSILNSVSTRVEDYIRGLNTQNTIREKETQEE